MITVVIWWLWLQVMGLAALPLAYRFFGRLPGRGYAFARPLGLLLSTYVLWLAGSLGLLRNNTGGALVAMGLVALASWVYYRRGRRPDDEADQGLLAWLRANRRLVLSVELLFAGALALWSLLRAYSPELTTAGGEKFMEIMYLNSIGRSDYFPPHDAWLAGYGISYYYFGYVMMATLTRLAGFGAHLTFNVGLASLFALTCTGAFGLVYDLVKGSDRKMGQPVGWGWLGAVLVAVLGNLEGFLEVLYSARLLPVGFWRWLDIQDINQPFDPALPASLLPNRSGWWWWRASRVIHDLDPAGQSMGIQPIDEFPGFSFLLGDMHPHVLALPFVLLALALALWALRQGGDSSGPAGQEPWWMPIRRLPLLVPLCLGGLAFLNTWDLPIYWLLFVVAYGLARRQSYGGWTWPLVRDVALTGVTAGVAGVLLYLPFYIGFQSQAGGLLPTLYVGTRFRQYFVMFGPFLVALAGLLVVLARQAVRQGAGKALLRRSLGWLALFVLVPLAVMWVLVLGLLLTEAGQQALEGMRRVPAVYAIVGDAPWPGVLAQLLLVKLRTWVMPLVVAGMAAVGMALVSVLRTPHPWPLPPEGRGEKERAPLPPEGRGERKRVLTPPEGREEKERVLTPPEGRGEKERVLTPPEGIGEKERVLTPSEGIGESERVPSRPWEREPEGQDRAGGGGDSLTFALLCAVAGLLLTLSVEFFYLVDNFGVRMNTIFKFYFQAWVLMAVASAFAVYWLSRRKSGLRLAFLGAFWLLFALGLVYPVLGNYSRAGNLDHAPTLDGTAYLQNSQADDHTAIAWLNENVAGAPIILEAPGTGGSSYVYEGRVSALTGLPTLLGWAGHEGQWRGNYDVQSAREPDIQTIYTTLDMDAARALLEKYGVSYVYVGPLERSKYDPRSLLKFERAMDVVYERGDVTIYKVSK